MRRIAAAGVIVGILAGLSPARAAQPVSPAPPTLGAPLLGLELWRGAKVGMTAAQVLTLFPMASPPAQPLSLTGGEVDRLQVAGVDLGGHPATARFFFRDAGLASVEVTLADLKPAQSARNVRISQDIAQELTRRYHSAYDCGDRSLGDVTIYECKWLQTPLSIRLWYMDAAGQAPLFYIAYRQVSDPGYNL